MNRTSWRLLWRQQRWELALLIGGALLLAAAMAFVAWQIPLTNESASACSQGASSAAGLTPECRSLIDWGNLWTASTGIFIGLATVAPFLVGLLLGAPVLAREIEKRTAPMAWSLSRSRRRWLAGRVLPLVLLVGVALVLVGQASTMLQNAAYPDGRGFMDYGSRGLIVPARGLAVFGVAVAVGLVCGRVLPAVLISGLLTIALIVGTELVRGDVMRAEATWIGVDQSQPDALAGISMVYDSGFVDDSTGERVTYEQASERFPEEFGPQGMGMPEGMTMVYLATPPDRYPSFVARESAALVGVALLAGLVATVLIGTRRPE
ncbi:MAG TPA: hypothetical protein VFW95_10275 [Candidatus Limnocylindria bacterium]|nr:hypothetical protein [Candidatus Limnocylindria bacterium]